MKTSFTRRAEAFADALDRSAAAGAVDATTAAAGVAPMVFLAERLAAVPLRPAGMGPAFRAALVAEAAATLAPAPSAPMTAPMTAPPAAAAPVGSAAGSSLSGLPAALSGTAFQLVAGALSVAVAVTGLGVGADRSVPGDALYGVKRLVERLQRDAAGSALGEARQLADEASARLAELRRLLDRGPLDLAGRLRVERLLADLSTALEGALDRLAGDVPQDLLDELTATWNTLAALVGELPAGAQAAALDTLAAVNNRLGALVDGASPVNGGVRPTPDGTTPSTAPPAVPTSRPSTGPTAPTPATPGPVGTPTVHVTPTTLPTVLPSTVPVVPPGAGPLPSAPSAVPDVPGPAGLPVPGPGSAVPQPELP